MSASMADLMRALPATERRFPAGAALFHRGDLVRAMHLILQGEAQLLRAGVDGGTLVLQRAGPGAVLAEASLFAVRYHCDARAASAVRLLRIDRTAMRAALAADPAFASAWAAHLTQAVQAARLRAEILSLRTVAERLDAWMAGTDGAPPRRGEGRTLAAEIGVSPEALYRELACRRAQR